MRCDAGAAGQTDRRQSKEGREKRGERRAKGRAVSRSSEQWPFPWREGEISSFLAPPVLRARQAWLVQPLRQVWLPAWLPALRARRVWLPAWLRVSRERRVWLPALPRVLRARQVWLLAWLRVLGVLAASPASLRVRF